MARPKRPWFRVYVEITRDPKIRRLTPEQRWLWIVVMSAARASCIPGFLMVSERVAYSWEDLADQAGMRVRAVEAGADLMDRLGMIEFDDLLGAWHVVNWDERQYESDDVTKRTAKHRNGNAQSEF